MLTLAYVSTQQVNVGTPARLLEALRHGDRERCALRCRCRLLCGKKVLRDALPFCFARRYTLSWRLLCPRRCGASTSSRAAKLRPATRDAQPVAQRATLLQSRVSLLFRYLTASKCTCRNEQARGLHLVASDLCGRDRSAAAALGSARSCFIRREAQKKPLCAPPAHQQKRICAETPVGTPTRLQRYFAAPAMRRAVGFAPAVALLRLNRRHAAVRNARLAPTTRRRRPHFRAARLRCVPARHLLTQPAESSRRAPRVQPRPPRCGQRYCLQYVPCRCVRWRHCCPRKAHFGWFMSCCRLVPFFGRRTRCTAPCLRRQCRVFWRPVVWCQIRRRLGHCAATAVIYRLHEAVFARVAVAQPCSQRRAVCWRHAPVGVASKQQGPWLL